MRWIQKTTDQSLVDASDRGAARRSRALRDVANAAHILAPLLVRRGIADAESASVFLALRSLISMHPSA
jgi:hypothetical protein